MSVLQLCFLFGTFYFVQGISEPTAGLISQPVKSLLRGWGLGADAIGNFWFMIGLPWVFKPVYGLLTDFVPLFGLRRRYYLLLCSSLAAAALGILPHLIVDRSSISLMLYLLVPTAIGIAFCDVVVDALMIETAQPRGLTGRIQSVQWSCIWTASILTTWLGGRLSQLGLQKLGLLICSAACTTAFVTAALMVREQPQRTRRGSFGAAFATLLKTAASPVVLSVGGFLLLWQFNPFSASVQYKYMTDILKFSEGFYGTISACYSAGALAASVFYGFYCRRISRTTLVYVTIVMGVVMTLGYWAVFNETSAVIVSVGAGLAYGTANVMMLDLAAQAAPPMAAGTTFALLMAASNLGLSSAELVGGNLYESFARLFSGNVPKLPLDHSAYTSSYNLLVAIGAATTACCWLLVPLMRRAQASVDRRQNGLS